MLPSESVQRSFLKFYEHMIEVPPHFLPTRVVESELCHERRDVSFCFYSETRSAYSHTHTHSLPRGRPTFDVIRYLFWAGVWKTVTRLCCCGV